jgi:5-methyltetrahydropteroyltriglutamate--homocysteine methyltransferase
MKRSEGRILTTHVGSLPNTAPLDRTAGDYEARLRTQVKEVVARQRALGIDVVNEGEYTKGGNWLAYLDERFGGFEVRPGEDGGAVMWQGRDREEFAEFYRYANEKGTLFYQPAAPQATTQRRPVRVCTSPVTYRAQADFEARDRYAEAGGRLGRGVPDQHRAREHRALPQQPVL